MKANFTPSQKDYKNITPFKLFVIEQFPFIEANFDAITEWQLLQEIGGKLNEIIKNMYNVTDNTKALYNSYIALENYINDYFDNLDVQDEINNKLNEMASSGQLEAIISLYLNSNAITVFTNVNSLKNAENLINGSTVKTLGFYYLNDGGDAFYRIRNITNEDIVDNIIIIPLNNENLIAELIISNFINVKKLGVKTDNTDNLSILQSINDKFNKKTLFFPAGCYSISNTLYISNHNNVLMDENAEIKAIQTMPYLIIYNKGNIVPQYDRAFNNFIKGGTLNGNDLVTEAVITMQGYMGFVLRDLKILNFLKYGLKSKMEGTSGNELFCTDCYFRNTTPHEDSLAINNNASDAMYSNIIIRDTHYGILTTTGLFHNIHGWIGFTSLLPNSYFIKSMDKGVMIDGCYSDTYQYPFISTFQSMHISNSLLLWNEGVYSHELQSQYPITIFKIEPDNFGLNSEGWFKVTNNMLHTQAFADDTNYLINKSNSNNNFIANQINNIEKMLGTEFCPLSEGNGGIGGSLNDRFVAGTYAVSDQNTDLPDGAYTWGILRVTPILKYSKGYISNTKINNLSYCMQEYIEHKGAPKTFRRWYSNNAGWSAWTLVSTDTALN